MQFFFNFWRSNLILCERVTPGHEKSQFYLNFWQSNLISYERICRTLCKSQFYISFWRSNLISRERVPSKFYKSQFLAIEPHFVRKDYPDKRNRNFISIFGDRTSFRVIEFVGRFTDRNFISILPQFFAIEPHFVRRGCVPCRWHYPSPSRKK